MQNLIVNNRNKIKYCSRPNPVYILLLLLPFVLSGCFEKDMPVPAYHWNGPSIQITKSIYDYQVF